MRKRSDIEGLHAIAILAVVLYHCRISWLGGGFVGVDVFFVVSGFLITSLMLTEIEQTRRLSFPAFYGRRARRLLPVACLVIVTTVAIGWIVLSPLERRRLVDDALSAVTYTVNWRLASQSTDYLRADAAPSALQHYWSLAVEEQFYLIWPIVIWLLAGARLSRRRVTVGLGVLVAASFVVCQVLTTRAQPWAFFGLQARLWQLGCGALLAVLWNLVAAIPRMVRTTVALAGIVGIALAITLFDDSTTWPGRAALLPTLATVAVLMGTGDSVVYRGLAAAPLQWIGARSYSWYLWHWPALVLGAAWLDSPLSVAQSLALAIAALGIAHVGYELVEQPVRHRARLVASPRQSIAVGLGLMSACAVVLVWARPLSDNVSSARYIGDRTSGTGRPRQPRRRPRAGRGDPDGAEQPAAEPRRQQGQRCHRLRAGLHLVLRRCRTGQL